MDNKKISNKYSGDFPIKFEGDNRKILSKILENVSELNGVEYVSGDICIESDVINDFLFVRTLKSMIENGDAEIQIKSDNSNDTYYLMKLFDEISSENK